MILKKKKPKDRLAEARDLLAENERAYMDELDKMDGRERMYQGSRDIAVLDGAPGKRSEKKTPHIRNIVAELIEAQVSSDLPAPKVTPRRKKDERLAQIIEGMLRDEMDRMNFEVMNDQMSRTVPIQGGGLYLVEWDNAQTTQTTIGELAVTGLHPKQVIPQAGVYSGIEDMDYIFLKLPQTKGYIYRRYGKDVADESEQEPEVRSDGDDSLANDMVTQYVMYFRNDDGGIGRYSWVGDTELEYLEDYQARRLKRCAKCGEKEPADEEVKPSGIPTLDGRRPEPDEDTSRPGKKVCPFCGSDEFEMADEEFEEIYEPIQRADGSMIPGVGEQLAVDEDGSEYVERAPTKVRWYKPKLFPIELQKNTSVYGRFLGGSDVDVIEDQQLNTNRLSRKVMEKLAEGGSIMTLPVDALIQKTDDDMRVYRLKNPSDKQMIDVITVQGDVSQDMAYMDQLYQEARQEIGITESFQGRKDTTATSGTAKEFAAAQTAGRLESKRIMREAAYAKLFELMFKFKLAYADEPRPVALPDQNGDVIFEEFNRYDFLEADEAGEWYWNDQFLFSCDTAAPLASNREAMWQETRMNLQTGAFGDPSQVTTLITFWARMEQLHYPGAGQTKKTLEDQMQQQQAMQQQMARVQMQMQLANQQAMQRDMQVLGSYPQAAAPIGAAPAGNMSGIGEGV